MVKLQKETEKFIVIFVGRLHSDKNIPFLIRAFKLLHQLHSESELWIIGQGYLKESLIELAKSLKINDVVKFLGFIDNQKLGQYYSQASVLVHPTVNDTFGLVVVEAMYFATPVIVPQGLISAPDLVDDGINGFIIDSNTDLDLAEKLVLLSRDPDLCKFMGQNAKIKAEKFSVAKAIDALEACYMELIGSEEETISQPNQDIRP